MHSSLDSQDITCPHCWEPHSIIIDSSAGDQTYIEDCSVCCHPIELIISISHDDTASVVVNAAQ